MLVKNGLDLEKSYLLTADNYMLSINENVEKDDPIRLFNTCCSHVY